MSAPEPASPLSGHMEPGRFGADAGAPVQLSERRAAIAQVMGRKSQDVALRAAIQGALGLELPRPGNSAASGPTTAIWVAPETWLILREGGNGDELICKLTSACGATASIADQTWGKSIIRISGAKARDVLAKGCRIDLHPRVFAPSRCAVTPIAHIHAALVQVDATPAFDLIIPSTLARDFVEWLRLSAAEFGYEIVA